MAAFRNSMLCYNCRYEPCPMNFELTIFGEEPKVVERKKFTFECTSTGGNPPSVFSYGKLYSTFR